MDFEIHRRVTMRILFTASRLEGFGGSEIVITELIEWFVSRGWYVTLFCEEVENLFQAELQPFITSQKLTIIHSLDFLPETEEFELIWITHNVWPQTRFLEVLNSKTKIITLHMGSLENRELNVHPEIENHYSNQILVVSGRTQERMVELGLDARKIKKFENPVPEIFIQFPAKPEPNKLSKILNISNHVPKELSGAVEKLKAKGIRVDQLGRGQDWMARLSPQIISDYDAIVTIGKSTQCCLVMGKPVYSYDHFGGAGWLSEENFELEAFNNFSGYHTKRRLGAEQIALEIEAGFDSAFAWTKTNRTKFVDRYSLNSEIANLQKSLNMTI
jgi:hypothetical protein